MYKFQTILKSGVLAILVATVVSLLGVSRADAASYTYNLFLGASGTITTNCDNCVLSASNITAWSMSVPGFLSVASTVPGAQLSVPAGDTEMVATPEGIKFNFGGTANGSFGPVVFSDPSGGVYFGADSGDPVSSGAPRGTVSGCSSTSGCMILTGADSNLAIASASVPFALGTVSYTFTGKVTSATGIYATAGATVTGTFKFDLDAGNGALPVSLTAPWSSASTGTSRVVASTLTSGSVTFADAGSTSNKTMVAGLATTGSSAPNEYFASDTEFSSATNSVQQSIQIVGGTGTKAPFNSNGLPSFQNAAGTGTLLATSGNATVGQLTYTITTLSAAPTTLSVSPASLTFPNTLANTSSAPLTVTITNTSPNQVFFNGLAVTQYFEITASNCPEILGPNTSCTASLVFVPPAAMPGSIPTATGSLTVNDDAQGAPQLVSLAGTSTLSPAPELNIPGSDLSFTQTVGTTSAERPVTLTNTGNAPLTFYSIALTSAPGLGATDAFTLRSACVPTLAPGKSCTVFVGFRPVVAGQAAANLVFSDNVSTGNGFTQFMELLGTGTTVPVPGLTSNVPSLNFANQTTGTASVKQAFNLTNTGTAPLKISSIALAGAKASDFILQNACVSTLPAGQHCAVFVTFKPSAAGNVSAAVVVTSNAGGLLSVALNGTATPATAPVLTLNTSSLRFGSTSDGTTTPMTQAVDLTNTSTAPLSLSSIAILGYEGGQIYFTLRNDCVPVLQPGRLCAVFITFNPMTLAGQANATLVINDNAQVSQQMVQLTGSVPPVGVTQVGD